MTKAGWVMVPLWILAMGLMGCSERSVQPPEPEAAAGTPMGEMASVAADDEEMEVEVGCAMCMYETEGIETCQTAAKVDGKVYLVSGGGLDAHASGLCSTTKQATLVGHLDGDRLVASSITVH